MSKRTQRETLEKIVYDYEAAPAKGNSTDEMIARTEYMLAKRMLSASQTGKKPGTASFSAAHLLATTLKNER